MLSWVRGGKLRWVKSLARFTQLVSGEQHLKSGLNGSPRHHPSQTSEEEKA